MTSDFFLVELLLNSDGVDTVRLLPILSINECIYVQQLQYLLKLSPQNNIILKNKRDLHPSFFQHVLEHLPVFVTFSSFFGINLKFPEHSTAEHSSLCRAVTLCQTTCEKKIYIH